MNSIILVLSTDPVFYVFTHLKMFTHKLSLSSNTNLHTQNVYTVKPICQRMRIDALQASTIMLIKHMQPNINIVCVFSVAFKKKAQLQRFLLVIQRLLSVIYQVSFKK